MPVQNLVPLGPGTTKSPQGISGDAPSFSWIPSESGGVYEEYRELNGELWQAQNATYNVSSGRWLPVDPTLPCRAFVQSAIKKDVEGRFCMQGISPIVWTTTWYITDAGVASLSLQVTSLPYNTDLSALGIYNVQAPKYNAIPTVNTPTQAAANTAAIQAACIDAVNNGGMVWFNPGTYFTNPGIIIQGQTRFFAMAGPSSASRIFVPLSSGGGDLFTVQTTGSTPGQVQFSNIMVQYDVPLTGNAFNLNGCQFPVFNNIFTQDCPTSIYVNKALETTISGCAFAITSQENCVTLNIDQGANDVFVSDVEMRSSAAHGDHNLNNTAINIGNCSVAFFDNVQISDYDNFAVTFTPGHANPGSGCSFIYFTACNLITVGSSIDFNPLGVNQGIQEVKFSSCLIRHSKWHGSPFDSQAGVVFEQVTNSLITAITFDNCTVDSFGGPGYLIYAGQHIKLSNGKCSGNNLGKNGNLGNISLVGACTEVEITDVNCAGATGYEPGTCQWGMFLGDGCQNVFIQHVNVRGCTLYNTNLTGGFFFGSVGSNIQILDCPGYNELGIIVATSIPAGQLGNAFGSAQVGAFSGANTVYYGDVEITIVGASHVSRNGHNTTATGGVWTLKAGNQDTMTVVGAPSAFTAIGQ